jgi:hypothetical protein
LLAGMCGTHETCFAILGDMKIDSGALQWVETALRACPALHAGVG